MTRNSNRQDQRPPACAGLGLLAVVFLLMTGLSLEVWLFIEMVNWINDVK